MKTSLVNRVEKLIKPKTKSKAAQAIDAAGFAERIEKKAYELYQKRGCEPGRDWEDWFEAERIVENELISG